MLNKKHGFTIIEVVLVLAIAGLIFLMVFVALPALQRSQRDTQRRQDMARVATALIQYQVNGGLFFSNSSAGYSSWGGNEKFTVGSGTDQNCVNPLNSTTHKPCAFVKDYLNSSGASENTFKDPDGTYYKVYFYKNKNITPTGSSKASDPPTLDHYIKIVYNTKCDGENIIDTGAGPNNFTVRYKLEGSGIVCVEG